MNTLDIKSAQPFTTNWWDDFLGETNNLTKTTVFKDCLTRNETVTMRMNVMEVIAQLAALRTTQYGYRVYIEGVLVDTAGMEKIYDCPPEKGEEFAHWANRCFPNQKFGMIINRGEKFCPELPQGVSKKIAPLLEKAGVPSLGITFTIFIGNYGWTPLGIHVDGRGENVLHFHLGDGPKEMYTWDKDIYESMTTDADRFNNKDVEKFLPYANAFPYDEGDLYFMPQGEYHIGKSDELSMGVTLWFNNHVKETLASRTMQLLIDQYLKSSPDFLGLDKNNISDISSFEEALELFEIPEEFENLTFKDALRLAYKDFRYCIYSHKGFWARPVPIAEDHDFTPSDTVELINPFTIEYYQTPDNKKLYIYVRGSKFSLNYHSCIIDIIDEINKGEKISVAELLLIMDREWDGNVLFYILNLFYTSHGIKIN